MKLSKGEILGAGIMVFGFAGLIFGITQLFRLSKQKKSLERFDKELTDLEIKKTI